MDHRRRRSKDATPQIIQQYADKYPWIRIVRRPDRGARKVGGGVVDAFYAGYDSINPLDFDYICKLDSRFGYPRSLLRADGRPHARQPAHRDVVGQALHAAYGRLVSELCGDETRSE
jgi:glycosyltransferase involved in cell wall biosynthesis